MSVGAAAAGAMLGAFALTACQTLDVDWLKDKPAEKEAVAVSDPAVLRLAEAAVRAQEALGKLAEARSGSVPAKVDIPTRVVPELQRRVTLDLVGSLEVVAERLAEEAGYDFAVFGARPPAPVIVELDVKDEPLIYVLENAGQQAGRTALLTADATRMLVRLDWLGQEPEPQAQGGGQ